MSLKTKCLDISSRLLTLILVNELVETFIIGMPVVASIVVLIKQSLTCMVYDR